MNFHSMQFFLDMCDLSLKALIFLYANGFFPGLRIHMIDNQLRYNSTVARSAKQERLMAVEFLERRDSCEGFLNLRDKKSL